MLLLIGAGRRHRESSRRARRAPNLGIAWNASVIPDLSGRVTGANVGIGLAAAEEPAVHGASVLLVSRGRGAPAAARLLINITGLLRERPPAAPEPRSSP
jgi:hypothetical protein